MDNNLVITVPISRSDRFYFSRKYDPTVIKPLLVEANVLSRTIRDIPILPNMAAQLEEELIRRSIFGTAAIEGNPLTEREVTSILLARGPIDSAQRAESGSIFGTAAIEGNPLTEREVTSILLARGPIDSAQRAEREIRNLKAAYNFVKEVDSKDFIFPIDENLVQKIHVLITVGIDKEHGRPGEYRLVRCKVGDADHGGTYVPPKLHSDIALLMKTFCEWMNGEEMKKEEPMVRAAAAHYHIGMIHPFFDGNGRTARLVEALLLQMSGFKYVPVMLSNYYYRNIHEYYHVFSFSRKHPEKEITPFVEFVLRGIIDSFEEIKTRVLFYIKKYTMGNYFEFLRKEKHINQRQYDLLNILLNSSFDTEIGVFDLFKTSPYAMLYRGRTERTAQRDVKKLVKLSVLKNAENGKYELNPGVLDAR